MDAIKLTVDAFQLSNLPEKRRTDTPIKPRRYSLEEYYKKYVYFSEEKQKVENDVTVRQNLPQITSDEYNSNPNRESKENILVSTQRLNEDETKTQDVDGKSQNFRKLEAISNLQRGTTILPEINEITALKVPEWLSNIQHSAQLLYEDETKNQIIDGKSQKFHKLEANSNLHQTTKLSEISENTVSKVSDRLPYLHLCPQLFNQETKTQSNDSKSQKLRKLESSSNLQRETILTEINENTVFKVPERLPYLQLCPQLFNQDETKTQSNDSKSQKLRKLEGSSNLQQETILTEINENTVFKVPKWLPNIKKVAESQMPSKSLNKDKTIQGSQDLKCYVTKKVEFQQSEHQMHNPSTKMSQSNNGVHTLIEIDQHLKNLSHVLRNFNSNPNTLTTTTTEVKDRSDCAKISSKNNIGELFLSRSDSEKRSPSRSDFEKNSQSRSDSKFKHNSEEGSTLQNDFKNTFESNVFLIDQQENSLKSISSDTKKKEIFISNRLETLENHIKYYSCELNAIPPWSTKLTTVLRNLATRRNYETCRYLLIHYGSEQRIPLFKIRQQFIEMLSTIKYTMEDILDIARYIFTNGNIRIDTGFIHKITSFWFEFLDEYTQFRSEFHQVKSDYPNFDDVDKNMEEHFNNLKEIFFAFQEGVIDLFENCFND